MRLEPLPSADGLGHGGRTGREREGLLVRELETGLDGLLVLVLHAAAVTLVYKCAQNLSHTMGLSEPCNALQSYGLTRPA